MLLTATVRPATARDAATCAAIYAPFVTDNWVSFELEPPTAEEMAAAFAGTPSGSTVR